MKKQLNLSATGRKLLRRCRCFCASHLLGIGVEVLKLKSFAIKEICLLLALSISVTGIFFSCKKETSCEGCKENNKPPIAIAGPDQVITLPTDSISLGGSASNDPDGTISDRFWKKISGPASFIITNTRTAETTVKKLAADTERLI